MMTTAFALSAIYFPAIFAIQCFKVPQNQQIQRDSYSTGRERDGDRDKFRSLVQKNLHLNRHIPPVCDEALRIATYNIHYFRNLHDTEANIQMVRDDLRATQPDIVAFQKVTDQRDQSRSTFDQMLKHEGYNYCIPSQKKDGDLRNFFASKFPYYGFQVMDLGHGRDVSSIYLDVGGKKIAVINTHLEVSSSKIRTKQVQSIISFIEKKVAPHCNQYILLGDFNSRRDSREVQAFLSRDLLVESFTALDAPCPHYTCWSGITVDFLFSSPALAKDLLGSYVYQTISSDQLPVLLDLKLGQPISRPAYKSTKLPLRSFINSKREWWYSSPVFAVLVVSVIVAAVVVHYRSSLI